MRLSLESMAIEMPAVFGHPNRIGFKGVLTRVDEASDKAPAGARGHRVLLTKRAAEAAIPSLLGMALDYSPRLDAHDTRRKIGLITRAEINEREIVIGGFLYGRDFPEIVEEIGKAAMSDQPSAVSRQPSAIRKTGVESQVSDVRENSAVKSVVAHQGKTDRDGNSVVPAHRPRTGRAGGSGLGMSYEITDAVVEDIEATIWVLKRVTFTGAAVLRRDKAAYGATWIELE